MPKNALLGLGPTSRPRNRLPEIMRGWMLERGNIDLMARPTVRNPDGSISTVRSMSVGFDDGEVLIPTISDDGRVLTPEEAISIYRKTGRHLGKFKTPQQAEMYAGWLHRQQAGTYK